MRNNKMTFHCPQFTELAPPEGYLPTTQSAQALFFYVFLVKRMQEDSKALVYEDETSPDTINRNYFKLMQSVATMYGVTPEEMVKHWPAVGLQLGKMGSPAFPDRFKYNTIPGVKTQ